MYVLPVPTQSAILANHLVADYLPSKLFNAVSVREAVKSTQISQYLLVFTVVTIIFLPPSFIAVRNFCLVQPRGATSPDSASTLTQPNFQTFYGMHLFDGPDGLSESTQKSFWIAFCSVTGGTYILAAGALTGVNKRKRIRGWLSVRSGTSAFEKQPAARGADASPSNSQGDASPVRDDEEPAGKGKGKATPVTDDFLGDMLRRQSRERNAEEGRIPEA